LPPVSDGLAVNQPLLVAGRLAGFVGQAPSVQAVEELGAIDLRGRLDGDEAIGAAGQPLLLVYDGP